MHMHTNTRAHMHTHTHTYARARTHTQKMMTPSIPRLLLRYPQATFSSEDHKCPQFTYGPQQLAIEPQA